MEKTEKVVITKPNFQTLQFNIVGTAPYVQNKFSAREQATIHDKQEEGHTAKKGKKKDKKDFQRCYEEALHIDENGHYGIPATAFRAAMISACKMAGFAMTRAKLSIFVCADGFDVGDETPMVRFTKGKPEYFEAAVRIKQTMDLRARPRWRPGWEMKLRIRYDADQFTTEDVANLLLRAGIGGVGEGRPDSKDSVGCGWGTFEIVNPK